MKPNLLFAALIATSGLGVLLLTNSPTEAEADTRGVRFWVTEYRVKLDMELDPDRSGQRPLSLQMRGRASLHGSDKVEFSWKVADARPYLPLIQSCGGVGRLSGTVVEMQSFGSSAKGIEGQGPLQTLSCRNILK